MLFSEEDAREDILFLIIITPYTTCLMIACRRHADIAYRPHSTLHLNASERHDFVYMPIADSYIVNI